MYKKYKRISEQVRLQRKLPEQYRLINFPNINRKRLKRIDRIIDAEEEWRIRINYIKLNKGYGRNGESGLISKLKKREQSLLPYIKNSSRVKKYKIRRINRIVQKIKDNT